MHTTTDSSGTDRTDPRHIAVGRYTDDPAANAHHSADIADMMADRSRGSAERAAASAATALNALRLAEDAADKAVLAAGRAPHTTRSDLAPIDKFLGAVGIIALAILAETACAVVTYALVRPVFASVANIEYPPNISQWTVPPPKTHEGTLDRSGGARP